MVVLPSSAVAPGVLAALHMTEVDRQCKDEVALKQYGTLVATCDRVYHQLPPTLVAEAGLLPGPQLRSLDLTAAIRLGVDCVVTDDRRMAEAATELGMTVMAPA